MLKGYGIGICMLTINPIDEFVRVARAADEGGLHSIWMAEGSHFFRDLGEPRSATTVAAAVALNTKRIVVGLGIVPPYTRHPGLLAQEAVSLAELSGGRFVMGLGAAKAAVMHMGYDQQTLKPIAAHREAIEIIRGLLKGDQFNYEGKMFRMEAPPRSRGQIQVQVPLAMGATGPQMLKLAGAIADAVLLPTFTTPAFVRYALAEIKKGADAVGRNVADIPLGATLPFSVHEDGKRARDAIRRLTAVYISNKVQNIRDDVLMKAAGLTLEEAEPISRTITEKGIEAGVKMVSDEIMDKVVIAGTPAECNARLLQYREAGLTLPLLYQALGPDKVEAVRLIAEKIKPVFERGTLHAASDGRPPG